MSKITFGEWDESIHLLPEQQDRIVRARSASTTPDRVDKASQTASFKGGKYSVTLNSCSCVDFSRNKRPCKHIYRLAIELGFLENGIVEVGEKYDDKTDLLKSFEGLDLDAKEQLKPIFYQVIYRRPVVLLEGGDFSELLVKSGLFIKVDILSVVSQLPASELKEIFGKMQFLDSPKLTSQAKTFVKWVESNPEEFSRSNQYFAALEVNPRAESLKNTIYRRLCRLFPDDYGDWY